MIVFLVGMPGSGKSYWMRKLSHALGWQSQDLDQEIQMAANQTISQLFAHGEQEFRNWEQKTLQSIVRTQKGKDLLISTGGGTICFPDNLCFMKEHGKIVYLEGDTHFIFHRIKQSKTPRPLLMADSEEILYEKIAQLLNSRHKFYSQADITVDAKSITLPIFTEIIKQLKNDHA